MIVVYTVFPDEFHIRCRKLEEATVVLLVDLEFNTNVELIVRNSLAAYTP